MKKSKKILTLLLTALLVLALGLTACGNQNPGPAEPEPQAAAPAPEPAPQPEPEPEPEPAPENPVIRLSTTTSVNDSGLLSYLQPEFEKDTGFKLEITSAGSGAAIEKGRTGDADSLLTHSPAAERDFVEEGFGEERVPFMYNFFVIVGPSDDPAGVRDCTDASEAFRKISETQGATFVSRGDESGTHSAEMRIWGIAEIEPEGEDWYVSTGQGMGASLNIASETGGYILTDKSTYLAHELRDTMEILLEKSEEMQNTYSIIAISEQRWENTNKAGADAFMEWMTSKKGLDMINAYGMAEYGEQLFFAMD
ncbi:MAG: substrate-binding domain-containing protein [Oscillospiraceae bacterium]|nr:substrate-binding domain-containing protein [Oscillospiraceae bacterium]